VRRDIRTSAGPGVLVRRLLLAGMGAGLARAALSAAASTAAASTGRAARLERTNYRGRSVSLVAGPALAAAASLSAGAGAAVEGNRELAAAALVASLGAGAVGLYDDVVGPRTAQAKGFRGHLGALRAGRVSSGLVKVVGIGAVGLVAAAMLPSRRPHGRLGRIVDVALGAGVIAGTANVVNLLDLRPGRALKAGLIVGVPLVASSASSATAAAAAAGPVGAAAALLVDDLDERVMIGDSGANALGALLGVALAARTGLFGRTALLAGLGALTAASEKVSFTAVIDATPGLRELDRLGRRA